MPLSALLGSRRTNYRALAGTLGAVVAAPTWIISASRQVLLGWIVAVAGVTLTQFRGRSRAIAWIAAVLAGGGLTLASPRVIRRILQLAENPLADRWEPMMLGVELWRSNPIFGIGPSLYGHYYVVAVREGWKWRSEPLPPVGMPWVHSIPIELLCEWGSVGSLAILFVGAVALKSLLGSLRARTECRLATLGACVLMVLAIVGLLDLTLIKDWCVITFWLGLGAMYTRPVADSAAGCGVR
jgi:hypothetical protein